MVVINDNIISKRQVLLSACNKGINILLVIFLFSAPLHYILGSKDLLIFLRIAQFAGLTLFLLSCHELFKKSKKQTVEYRTSNFTLIFLILIISLIICKISNHNFYVYDFVYPLVYFGCCINLVKYKHPSNVFKIIFYLISIFLTYKAIFVSNPHYWIKGSANQVSALIIPACILLYIENYRFGKCITLLPAILTFIISVICYGTGGIISSFALLTGIFLIRFTINRNISKIFYLFTLITLIVVLTLSAGVILPFFREFFQTFISLQSGSEPRLGVILYYFETMSISEYIFGNPNALESYIQMYNLTSHNSYLSIHSALGLGIVFAFFMILKSIVFLFSKKLYFLIFLLFVLFLRASTDNLLYTGHLFFTIPFFYIIALSCHSVFPTTNKKLILLKN